MTEGIDLERFRRRLLQEKEELEERAHSERQSMREATGELSLADNHPADIGSELFERAKDLALREDALLKLQAIEDALRRLEEGTYGRCESCGAPIPRERLEAVPYTTLCHACKEKQEAEKVKRIRPVEEEVLGTPFLEAGDDLGYNQEEVWEDVAQHSLSTELEEREGADGIPVTREDGVWYQDFRPYEDPPAGKS
ncbi:TraR/DksA C4-type zinc finger protein [Ammonifex thiophilus]|uniref:Conjugal transfer protein TraR n=1 Tax=Ammonifex thiophilus TaxID=444093 RepID=A0A3D8P4W0_9THEO|nr:TraR/DksA C4-type zinc finger protein [Ammonifex thiophilus]RDV83004.1 conjugal transfer protein TraR [Ammonifex thiophilus]